MDTCEVLAKVRDRIANPRHWTQHRLVSATPVRSGLLRRTEVYPVCLLGAINEVTSGDPLISGPGARPARARLGRIVEERGSAFTVLRYNDTHSHKEVISLVDKALEGCQ